MDRGESRLHNAAAAKGLSIRKAEDGSWVIGAATSGGIDAEFLLADGKVRLADGREYPRRMTTGELRKALGLPDED